MTTFEESIADARAALEQPDEFDAAVVGLLQQGGDSTIPEIKLAARDGGIDDHRDILGAYVLAVARSTELSPESVARLAARDAHRFDSLADVVAIQTQGVGSE